MYLGVGRGERTFSIVRRDAVGYGIHIEMIRTSSGFPLLCFPLGWWSQRAAGALFCRGVPLARFVCEGGGGAPSGGRADEVCDKSVALGEFSVVG